MQSFLPRAQYTSRPCRETLLISYCVQPGSSRFAYLRAFSFPYQGDVGHVPDRRSTVWPGSSTGRYLHVLIALPHEPYLLTPQYQAGRRTPQAMCQKRARRKMSRFPSAKIGRSRKLLLPPLLPLPPLPSRGRRGDGADPEALLQHPLLEVVLLLLRLHFSPHLLLLLLPSGRQRSSREVANDAPVSTGWLRVGRGFREECRRLRSLLCGPDSARLIPRGGVPVGLRASRSPPPPCPLLSPWG